MDLYLHSPSRTKSDFCLEGLCLFHRLPNTPEIRIFSDVSELADLSWPDHGLPLWQQLWQPSQQTAQAAKRRGTLHTKQAAILARAIQSSMSHIERDAGDGGMICTSGSPCI